MQAQVGTLVEAITLQSREQDFTEALTDNYLKIKIRGRWQANRWIATEVANVADGGQSLVGTPPDNAQVHGDSFGAPEMATQPT